MLCNVTSRSVDVGSVTVGGLDGSLKHSEGSLDHSSESRDNCMAPEECSPGSSLTQCTIQWITIGSHTPDGSCLSKTRAQKAVQGHHCTERSCILRWEGGEQCLVLKKMLIT